MSTAIETAKAKAEARAALNKQAQERWDDPSFHREMAALISTRLDWGFEFNNAFNNYIEVQTVGATDQVEITERRGIEVFWTARNGYIDETQLQTNRWTLPRDTIGFHVSEFEDKLKANYGETLETVIGLAERRMDAEINRRIFTMMQTAIGVSSPYYVNATSGLTKEILDTAVTEVADVMQPDNVDFRTGITILGRRAAIDMVIDVASASGPGLYDQNLSDEVRRTGRIGTYKGANVQVLDNYGDADGVSYFSENELWIFGGQVGKFVFYGGSTTKSWTEDDVDYVHYRSRRDCGGLVYRPEMARRVVITDES